MSEFVIKPFSGVVNKRNKYPWRDLEIGQSFTVPFDSTREGSLRYLASLTGKKLGRLFFVKKHNDAKVYEVGRLSIEVNASPYEIKQRENGFPESFDARNYKIETPKIVISVGNKEEMDYKEWDDIPIDPMTTKLVVEVDVPNEPWKSPILDPCVNPANVVKRVEVPVEPENKSEWVLPKKE